mmetsp:Transcript_3660/g.5427  ORF Transcript_3660/g.5427 Transcript_3660/m.5427 type:complete len:159 (-) Transcript_3660:161-637(-)|eukprot:CAMPEP_0113944330 /NCGR_PEP_ID=MMETSP1339-20121228/33387_1 /TAXON_ID=94617 /ORGANISM="Fibrocapsa japonica" /LENGTH=158 /DNA_ID=CAMNT_0000949497 /DNA_START=66 /DNA_END=542 /DNA_ORIENTATION=+ /assembly_acc=CAM_ASM_000762
MIRKWFLANLLLLLLFLTGILVVISEAPEEEIPEPDLHDHVEVPPLKKEECEQACWEILDEEEIREVAEEKCKRMKRYPPRPAMFELCIQMFEEVTESACEHACDERIEFSKNNCMKGVRDKRVPPKEGTMACRLGRKGAIKWAAQVYEEEYGIKGEL